MVEVSEQKKKDIFLEAKRILDNFSKALEKVEFKEKKDKADIAGFREEGVGKLDNQDFRKRMFDNAPKKNDNFVIAETKKW